MTQNRAKKKTKRKSARKVTRPGKKSVGPRLVRTRHARDGTPVPMESDKGRTVSKVWDATESGLGDWEPARPQGSRELREALVGSEPPDEGRSIKQIEDWANSVLEKANNAGESMSRVSDNMHSQNALAFWARQACRHIEWAIEMGDPEAAAKWGAYAQDRYWIAQFKEVAEEDSVRGGRVRRGDSHLLAAIVLSTERLLRKQGPGGTPTPKFRASIWLEIWLSIIRISIRTRFGGGLHP